MRKFFIILASLAVAGCMVSEISEETVYVNIDYPTYTATFDDESTKVYVDTDLKMHWNAGDEISIFRTAGNQRYSFDGADGDREGTFSVQGDPQGGSELQRAYAVYPYSEDTSINTDGLITLNLPSVQNYAENSFGQGANTMVAVTESKDSDKLYFKNLCGYLVVKLYGEGTIKSITLTGNNGEKLSGQATVVPVHGEVPILTMSESAGNSITLDCGEGVALGSTAENATAFWFAIPPVTFSNGFTVTVTTDEASTITKRMGVERTVERNVKYSLAPVKVSPLRIAFDSTDLVVMPINATRDIHYSITSEPGDITVEAYASGNVEATVEKNDSYTGVIRVTTGSVIDETTNVVVLVSNGSQAIMRTLNFEEEAIEVEENTTKEVSDAGGEVALEFFSNTPCHAVIPEEAQCWISVVPPSKALTKQTITLAVEANNGAARSATVTVQSKDGTLVLLYVIDQPADHYYQMSKEKEVLISILDAVSPSSQEKLSSENWGSDMPLNSWYGVEVDNELVVGLNLVGVDFIKAIPDNISNLTNLKRIYISGTKFTDPLEDPRGIDGCTIPKTIGELSKLESFIINHGDFVGSIPSEFSRIPNLKVLSISQTGISGSIPSEICNIESLEQLAFSFNPISGTIPKEIGKLKNLRSLALHGRESQLSGSIPVELCNLSKLESLYLGAQLSGEIPHEIGNLKNLKQFTINWSNISGCIPVEIGSLTNLQYLSIDDSPISGEIPHSLVNCQKLEGLFVMCCPITGPLPAWLSEIPSLKRLSFYGTNMSGMIPREWAQLPLLYEINLSRCPYLYGPIPEEVLRMKAFKYTWGDWVNGTNFDLVGVKIPAPEFHVTSLDGVTIDSAEEYAKNHFTVLFQWNYWCPSINETPTLVALYNKYHSQGLNVIGWSDDDAPEYLEHPVPMSQTIAKYGMPWQNFVVPATEREGYGVFGNVKNKYPGGIAGAIALVDDDGYIIWSNLYDDMENLTKIVDDYYEGTPQGVYKSTDYSSNGVVTKMQSATRGNGIDLVLMGDGYSDRLIADGTYDVIMDQLKTAFFNEEPYSSMDDCFNVYSVKVVSDYESSTDGFTALRTWFGSGTRVGGNNSLCINYALKAIPENKMDDAIIVVAINSDAYAGTCYMYPTQVGDYGQGLSISYFPIGPDFSQLENLIHHEAGGHGFAKLADEYAYEDNGAIRQSIINDIREREPYGWWKNIDFTDEPTQVKWAQFIADPRYASENIGCYEGAYTYWTGAWRPTENSIMRYNTGGFNAPSRYAIWYRINKLAYGDSWNGTYEDFVAYDAVNRTPAAVARRNVRRNCVEKNLPPLAPPVVVGHSWRDAK